PEIVMPVFHDLPDVVVREAGSIGGVVAVVDEALAIEAVQPPEVRADPELFLMIDPEAHDHVRAEAVGIARLMKILSERVPAPVEIDQPAAIRADPDIAG